MPVTFKAGLAYVSEHLKLTQSDNRTDPQIIIEQALDKASKAFSDSYAEDTDFAGSLYVQRSFDNFEPLCIDLPDWAAILYADLIQTATMEGGST